MSDQQLYLALVEAMRKLLHKQARDAAAYRELEARVRRLRNENADLRGKLSRATTAQTDADELEALSPSRSRHAQYRR
jgi:hypothetical protein